MQETDYEQLRKEFDKKYTNTLLPCLKILDDKRKLNLQLAKLSCYISFILGLIAFITGFIKYGISMELVTISCVISLFGMIIWEILKKKFENSIKKRIMPTFCKLFGDMKWSNKIYNDMENIKRSCVVPNYTNASVDDIFQGSWKDIKFDIVESEYQIFGHKQVFKALVIKLSMNKKFASHTVIKSIYKQYTPGGLRKTKFEDVEFEKKYDVYTNDEVDARYLITTAFMERFNALTEIFRTMSANCSFYQDNFYIAIENYKDFFNLGSLVKPVDDYKQYATMYEEIVSIIKLIEYFKLNQKLGL